MTTDPNRTGQPTGDARPTAADHVRVEGWSESAPPRRKAFPGPQHIGEPLRVTLARAAYAELIAHAKEELDAEVCGVLVGELCEDDNGVYVSVHAIIRGNAARQGGAHVTYTQETWDQIHARLAEDFPQLQIVGWYHSHPGFGVEFSDMDLFIQEHFFAGPAQIAFVTDPLGGEEALCANTPAGRAHLARFWVEGRERRCHLPSRVGASGPGAPTGSEPRMDKALRFLEERLSQLTTAVEEQRALWYRFLFIIGTLAALCFVGSVAYYVYERWTVRLTPPELRSYVPVSVKIGDRAVLLGVGVVDWAVPPELNAAYIELERQKQAAEAARTSAEEAASQPALQERPTEQRDTSGPAPDHMKGNQP